MTNPNPIRLGFLGVGGIARTHINAIAALPDFEITAFADPSDEGADEVQTSFGISNRYHDYHELLKKEKLDAVYIVLPTFLHTEATLAALDAGVHVLCEKPPTSDLAEMRLVEAKVLESGLVYMFGRQGRFAESVLNARKQIEQGRLGEICGAQAQWIRVRCPQLRGHTWRTKRDQGGGVLLDLGIHGIDTIWFALGCPRITEVSAANFSAFRQMSEDPEQYTADDGAMGWIRFEGGCVLQYAFAFGMNLPGIFQEGRDGIQRKQEWNDCRIFGSLGGVDIYKNQWISGPFDAATVEPMTSNSEVPDQFTGQALEFARAIRENDTPINSVHHAVQLMQLLETLRASSEQGRSIRLQLDDPENPPKRQPENHELGYDTTPILPDSGYHVHDGTRPQPPTVTPGRGNSPPSDALVLFNGKNLDAWESIEGGPAPWAVRDGCFEVVPGSKNIRTKELFGNLQLHLEFASPEDTEGKHGQQRGNSGVFLMGLYEVQVLDNYENPTYADGTVGALYGQQPPLVNAIRPPGEWNTFDIVWEAPKMNEAQVLRPARITVLLNNVLLHHAKELLGPTQHKVLPIGSPHSPTGPIVLQDHKDLVRYRNIWLRKVGDKEIG